MSRKPVVFYVGNILSEHGNTPTFIETLAPKINTILPTIAVSNKKNKIVRLFHMVSVFLMNIKSIRFILIDTYSTLNFSYAVMFAFFGRLYKKKYIPILRGGDLPSLLNRHPVLSEFVFRHAFSNVSPSNYLACAFQERSFEVKYIPNFVNLEKYFFRQRNVLNPTLCWVRAYQDIYNPIMALQITERLRKRGISATLVMIGPDKGARIEVERYIKEKQLVPYVRLYGKLEKHEWLQLANENDIFINTTNVDNRPVSIIEAMAIGIPVVSTNAGGLPDMIISGEDGILVSVGDVDAFVNAVENLLSDSSLAARLSCNGRIKAESFTWTAVKSQWVNLLTE